MRIQHLLVMLVWLTLMFVPLSTRAQTDIRSLSVGQSIERELKGDEAHSYSIAVTFSQFLHVVVDQRGIDLVVRLFGPDGKKLAEVDTPNGTQGPEPLYVIIEGTGNYRLEIRSLEKDAPTGHYEAKIVELRTATEKDKNMVKNQIASQKAFAEGEALRSQGTAELLRAAIKKYEEALPLYRTVGDKGGEANTLIVVGSVYDDLGEKQKALKFYNEALPLFRVVGDKGGLADTLNNIGLVYSDLGDKQQALKFYRESLPLRRAVGDKGGEAKTLNNIGAVYSALGENENALKLYNESLALFRVVGDKGEEASTLNNIGKVHDDLGEKQQALKFYNESLPLRRAVGDKGGEASTLNNIGAVYSALGENQKALKFLNESLPLRRAVGDKGGEATTLNNIGKVHDDLGEKKQALKLYNESLPLFRAVGDKGGEASTLNNIGAVYSALGEKQQALKLYNESLPLRRAVGDKGGEAVTLNNIGKVHDDLGEKKQALKLYNESLPLFRAVGNKSGEAATLSNIGMAYRDLGEKQQALKYFIASLPLFRAVGDNSGVAKTLHNLFYNLTSGNPRFGVFLGKQSVNNFQILRSNVRGLDKDIQQTYLKSIEKTYRGLADELINQQRLAEAQQVLNLFKDQQYFDFSANLQATPLALTTRESELIIAFNQKLERSVTVIWQLDGYKRTIGRREPNKSEAEQIQIYEADLKAANDDYLAFLKQAETDFSQSLSDKDKVGEIPDTKEMQTTLRNLQSQTKEKAVAVYSLVGESNFWVLIITPDGITPVVSLVKGKELNKKAIEFLGQISEVDKQTSAPKSSEADVQRTGKELYDIVFVPVAAKLKELGLKPDVLMWSLDGALRYIPVAALYDGKQYLAERYRNVVFTRANSERMLAPVSPTWTCSAFYSSKEYSVPVNGRMIRFDRLQYAREEVETTFGTTQKPGFLTGSVMPDEQFTKVTLLKGLQQHRPLVHIASHFRLEPGDASVSFLLLGDGTTLTLADIKNEADDLFGGVELLTLSACESGVQKERESDGREIDSFAELAQRKGTKAVLASLWRVDDESTSRLMMEFYRTRQTNKLTKAEALQKAQLNLLKHSRYSHPYYWSPFILIGNWR